MQEQRFLREVEAERVQLHNELWTQLDDETSARAAQQVDVQSLLVELDRRGVFPAELLPEPAASTSSHATNRPGHPAEAAAHPNEGIPGGPRSGFPR